MRVYFRRRSILHLLLGTGFSLLLLFSVHIGAASNSSSSSSPPQLLHQLHIIILKQAVTVHQMRRQVPHILQLANLLLLRVCQTGIEMHPQALQGSELVPAPLPPGSLVLGQSLHWPHLPISIIALLLPFKPSLPASGRDVSKITSWAPSISSLKEELRAKMLSISFVCSGCLLLMIGVSP
ncbi:hypothetical protein Tsubulata_049593, partial [Turnera subulata]